MKTIYLILLSFGSLKQFSQTIKPVDFKDLRGTYVNKVNTTKDGKVYNGIKCKDTITLFNDGKFRWGYCEGPLTGNWKIDAPQKKIILYNKKSKYLENLLKTKDLGVSEIEIKELNKKQMILIVYDEALGAIDQLFIRIK